MIEHACFSKPDGDGEKEEGAMISKRNSSISSGLEEARGGAGKVTPFASVSSLKDRLSKNLFTSRCRFVPVLRNYQEKQHVDHKTMNGPSPFGSRLVY